MDKSYTSVGLFKPTYAELNGLSPWQKVKKIEEIIKNLYE